MPTDPERDAPGAAAEGLGAGPELDRLVAEKVFGRETFRCTDTIHAAGIRCPIWRYRVRSDEEPDHISAEPGVPPYSTDIAAAWAVVERAIDYQLSSCGMVDHSRPIADSEDHRHRADLWFGPRGRGGRGTSGWGYGVADTLPEAICRAALVACRTLQEEAAEAQAARGEGE